MSQRHAPGVHGSTGSGMLHAAAAWGGLQLEQDRRHLVDNLTRAVCSTAARCTAQIKFQELVEHDPGTSSNAASKLAANIHDGGTLHPCTWYSMTPLAAAALHLRSLSCWCTAQLLPLWLQCYSPDQTMQTTRG